MAATPLLGLTLPVSGTLAGTWGDTVNNEITSLLDTAVAGTTTLASDANVTLTSIASTANQARAAMIVFSGPRTALRTVTAPSQSKIYVLQNQTSGGFSVTFAGVGPTTGVTILNGEYAVVAWNGADFVRISTLGGPITGSTGTFTGAVSGSTGTFTGNVSGVNGTFTGPVSGTTGTFSGNVQMASANGGQLAGLRNKIINGNMTICQRATSTAGITGSTTSFLVDRFRTGGQSTTGVVTTSQSSDVPSGLYGFSARIAVTTADTSIASTEVFAIVQPIEGYNIRDLFGTTFTLSFWVRSSKTGIHCVAFTNSGPDRSYVVEYTISAANTWEYKTITVSGGLTTAGTWDLANGTGVSLRFALMVGSSFQTTAGAWNTGNFFGTSGQVNCLDTIGNIFAITNVQLEVGPVATPFEQIPYGLNLQLCQRYYFGWISPALLNIAGYTTAGGGAIYVSYSLPQVMRTTPVAVTSWTSLINATGSATRYPDNKTIESNIVSVAAGTESGVFNITSASAEL